MTDQNTARVARVRSSKTGEIRFVVKVGERKLGRPVRRRTEAKEAADKWNARYSGEAKLARAAADAKLLAALAGGPLTLDEAGDIMGWKSEARAAAERLIRRGLVTKKARRTSRVVPQKWLGEAKDVPLLVVTYTRVD